MRRLALVLLLAAALLPLRLQAQDAAPLDSALTAALDSRLDEYFAALEREPIQVKIGECDFMLESCDDPLVKQYVAVRIYDHFLGSKVMGDEAVAVHMVDDWFVPGKVAMYSDIDLMNAKIYAQFHRSSLIGMEAPALTLRDIDGSAVPAPAAGAVSVLFFYDTSCSKCKLETLRLNGFLPEVDVPLEFYAIYTGAFKEQWQDYITFRWDIDCPSVKIHHVWDPELESDFQVLYGVLQTPQMLLIDRNGIIVGRSLDTEALAKLLPTLFEQPYEYGAEPSTELFDTLFGDGEPSAANILETAQYIKDRALERSDSVLCRHMLGDMMYYLMDTPGEEYKLALHTFITLYVKGDPAMWSSPSDQQRIVRPAEVCMDLLDRVPVGSRIPKVKVRGVLLKGEGLVDLSAVRTRNLRRLRGNPAYVLFHTPGCSSCDAELEAVQGVFAKEPGARVLLVNPEENGTELLDTFDLSVLPFTLKMDRKGTVQGKYISFL
ncbi:MAG: redoxin domain-containing protein [Bacteroidales bacterium]|nr:redoxin domain-containing protein [Bacteroidales bacterium]